MGHPWQAAGKVLCHAASPAAARPPRGGGLRRVLPCGQSKQHQQRPVLPKQGASAGLDLRPHTISLFLSLAQHHCRMGPLGAPQDLSSHQVHGILQSSPVGRSTAKPPWLVTRQPTLQGPSLWLFKFPFHEQMKHFIFYDLPTMAVIPFHLSGTRDDGGRTRALGYWQRVLSTREDTFTFT